MCEHREIVFTCSILMSSGFSTIESTRLHLKKIRTSFLHLHKALLDSEQLLYERSYGPIRSSGELLQLVIGHEWFSWLRPMSQFIIQIDEALGAKEPMTQEQAHELLTIAHQLLRSSEDGPSNEQRYYDAIQRDADIAFLHFELSAFLATSPTIQP